ncbi:hypothetical protein B0T20DRAFT_420773 [Sordaria brevicollis]|uniref:Queuosine 5'-phosphate N-glycosylase/hydrolase n=1 Tax=Sordaria brevicollis TaxID=83679 RepID=A0AAE0P2W5_SORBR|nr:hypothetical protein B0T20DRAFT_420773 [Sordaria brevicollis]
MSKSHLTTPFSSQLLPVHSFGSLLTRSRLTHTSTTRFRKMAYSSDSEPDTELLDLLRQHLQGKSSAPTAAETGVLESAEFVYNHAIDVALDMRGCKKAAETIWTSMQQREYSPATWSTHELHPKTKDEETVKFIFAMDILNFSFWSELPEEERFQIEYRGKKWTGYWSLVAGLQRGLEEGIPITDPLFWVDPTFTPDVLRTVFRSATSEEIPLLQERFDCLRQAGQILCDNYDGSVLSLIDAAQGSAAALVNLLASDFPCFADIHPHPARRQPIRILKRAQIFVADLWACFEGQSYGSFSDIDKITMFADYRVPQMLWQLNCLLYGPTLEAAVREKRMIEHGSEWELQLRACSIWCVELIKREIIREHPEAKGKVNAVLIDFFLYDAVKELEAEHKERIPHHRTRSIWY